MEEKQSIPFVNDKVHLIQMHHTKRGGTLPASENKLLAAKISKNILNTYQD